MRTICLCLLACGLALTGGCRGVQWRPSFAKPDIVASTATKDEVVALVNRNITGAQDQGGLMSWRCLQARFQMPPLPGWAPGTLMVEAPRNFRLRVSHPIGGGDLLDVGSNTDEFWIWQKEMNPPYLLTAQHRDMPVALRHFKVPFQPDWIMEVLGVIPIDGNQYELRPTPGKPYLELAASSVAPSGETVRKEIRVNTQTGWVREHLLWGPGNKLIASAELSDHRVDPKSKLVTPRKVRIHWPEADMDLKITLDHLEVNPVEVPAMAWQVPQKAGYKRLDMGEFARQQTGSRGIQYVEHEVPARTETAPRTGAPAVNSPQPFPETTQTPVGGLPQAAPFPNEFPVDAPAVVGASGEVPIPLRDNSVPLSPPGRVRVGELAPSR